MKWNYISGSVLSALFLLGCGTDGGLVPSAPGGPGPLAGPAGTLQQKGTSMRGMSPAGALAARAVAAARRQQQGGYQYATLDCVNMPDCPDEDMPFTLEDGPVGTRSEVSLAAIPERVARFPTLVNLPYDLLPLRKS